MIDAEMRKSIFLLHQSGMGIRELVRRLKVNRNTVRKIIEQKGAVPKTVRNDKVMIESDLLERLHKECDGRIQRVHEKLTEEEGIEIKYSTLTRLLRDMEISRPAQSRCDQVPDEPGVEMQHDTSPYNVLIGDKKVGVHASLLYLRYSKRRYLKFYFKFNRFNMKCFFHEALTYWGYAAPLCIIDNTNLARHSGAGANARIAPEMETFGQQFGFRYKCHAINHPNRKAGDERGFYTVETNFLPGRRFQNIEDLNQQAFVWATDRLYRRPLTAARIISEEAFVDEQPLLVPVPPHVPAPYLTHQRLVNQYGYIPFAANHYWVPGTKRGTVKVLQYAGAIHIYQNRERLAEYPLAAEGVRNQQISPPGMPVSRFSKPKRKRPADEQEKLLRDMSPVVGQYLDFVFAPGGIKKHHFVRKLHALSKRMTSGLFIRSLERALKYGVTNIETIERIASLYLDLKDEDPGHVEVDESFSDRESFLEGEVTDQPDLSIFDDDEEEEEHEDE